MSLDARKEPSGTADDGSGYPATSEFEQDLKKLCDRPVGVHYLRPFSWNSNWKTASVFIIGDNPSTPRRDEFDDFNDYWTALTYNIEKFDEAYKSKRLDDRATKTTVQTEKLVDLNREGALPRDKHLLGGYPRLGYDFCSGAALSA